MNNSFFPIEDRVKDVSESKKKTFLCEKEGEEEERKTNRCF